MNSYLNSAADEVVYVTQYDTSESRSETALNNLCMALGVSTGYCAPEQKQLYLIAALAKHVAALEP
jgi:hypothetical protein